MAVQAATEARLLDQLNTALAAITTTPANYLTTPVLGEGVPLDSVTTGTKPHIFADYVRSNLPGDAAMGGAFHRLEVTMCIWIVSSTVRLLLAAKADVLRAIFAAEGAFTGAFGTPLWPTDFAVRDEMSPAGEYVGVQLATITVELSHSAP